MTDSPILVWKGGEGVGGGPVGKTFVRPRQFILRYRTRGKRIKHRSYISFCVVNRVKRCDKSYITWHTIQSVLVCHTLLCLPYKIVQRCGPWDDGIGWINMVIIILIQTVHVCHCQSPSTSPYSPSISSHCQHKDQDDTLYALAIDSVGLDGEVKNLEYRELL